MKSMEMKKKLKRIVSCAVFLALVWTVFVRCTYLFRETANNRRPKILDFYLEESDSLDVVFIGGSSVYVFWDPMLAWHEYGFTSYCYSVDSMPADIMLYCLRDIQKTQNPVVVVVEVRHFLAGYSDHDINSGGHRWVFDSWDFGLERLKAANYARKLSGISVKDTVTEFIDLIYYHNNKSVLANKSNWVMWNNRIAEHNGLYYKGNKISTNLIHEFFQMPEVISNEVSPLNEADERALKDLLTYCQENNTQVLLVASPYILNEDNSEGLNAIAEIADEYNTPFLNANQYFTEMGIDCSTDFYNRDHTNLLGMEKFTHFVSNYLKEYYVIPNRYDDALIAAWDELYDSYEEDAKNIKNRILTTVENKMQAIANGNAMRMTSDAGEWLSLANNDNMTVLVLMDQNSEFSPSLVNEQLLKIYGLTTSILEEEDHYLCVYSGKIVSSSTSDSSLSGNFGSRFENKLEYSLSVGERLQIIVGNHNYFEGVQNGLHMVVFDNNTYDFIDSVSITISSDGELHLEHNPAFE